MASEASWQASSAGTRAGDNAPYSDQDSVEILLRRLIQRVEESERRYDEALDELHVRLDRLSRTPDGPGTPASPEETETLERLRHQLSGLAARLEQPPEAAAATEALSPLERALSEVRAVSAGLAATEPGLFAAPRAPVSDSFAGREHAFSFSAPANEPHHSLPPLELPGIGGEDDDDFDRRLIDMAQRLEHSLGEAMPSTTIETLNARMEQIAATFEAALQQSPKLEHLQRLERQLTEMGQQLGRAEQHIARIGVIESQLQRLIGRLDDAPAELESVANKAATEAARLVAETGKPGAAERLDDLHRDIIALNERSRVTDDRMVDTLEAMHSSLKGLVQQAEPPMPPQRTRLSPGEAEKASAASPKPVETAPHRGEVSSGEPARHYRGEEKRDAKGSLRERLFDIPEFEDHAPRAPFGRAKRGASAPEPIGLDAIAPSARGATFTTDVSFDSMEDLVAAARRAAQAAAARAEQRDAARHTKTVAAGESLSHLGGELPERRKRPILMIIAALLLMVSAALLYSRLQLKPNFEAAPSATEQTGPASTTGSAPAREPPTAATPAPEAGPTEAPQLEFSPEASPAPAIVPEEPHATTPSVKSGEFEVPAAVRVSENAASAMELANLVPGTRPTNMLVEP